MKQGWLEPLKNLYYTRLYKGVAYVWKIIIIFNYQKVGL